MCGARTAEETLTNLEWDLTNARIRPWRSGDEASLVVHADDRAVWRNLRDTFPHPYTPADAADYIARRTAQEVPSVFAIEVDGEAAGSIGLHPQADVSRRSAEIGYWLGRRYWGRGIMTEAVRVMTEHGLVDRGFVRIYAAVFEWNPASMRVLEKAGYKLEGRLRRAVTKDGQTIDELLYAIVGDDAELA